MEGESCGYLRAALPGNPALVEGHDLPAEASLCCHLSQEFPGTQKPCGYVCITNLLYQSTCLQLISCVRALIQGLYVAKIYWLISN